jgi:hypothetical protein
LVIVYLGICIVLCTGAAEREAESGVMRFQRTAADQIALPRTTRLQGVKLPLKCRTYRFHSALIVAQRSLEHKFSGWMPWIVRTFVAPPSLAECSLLEYNASVC